MNREALITANPRNNIQFHLEGSKTHRKVHTVWSFLYEGQEKTKLISNDEK